MSAWGAPQGAWANQVDEEEAENGGELDPVPGVSTAFPALGDTSFPSLGEAITAKDTKRDRKQKGGPQKMSLGSFMAAPEKVVLPTGPRERAEGEEERRGLGGGFKTYGGDRGGFGRDRDEEGGFGREDPGPSRADADGDWGSKKTVLPSGSSRGFGDRGGGFRDREAGSGGFSDRYSERRSGFVEGGNPYRADEADKWGNKNYEPSTSRRGGFESRDKERYGGFKDDYGSGKADTEDRWSRRAPADLPSSTAPTGTRPRLNLKPRSKDLPLPELPPPASTSSRASEASNDDQGLTLPITRSASRSNPFGDAKPVAVKELPETAPQATPEASSNGSEQPEQHEPKSATPSPRAEQPRARSNPFGDARPREEVLKEKEHLTPAASTEQPVDPVDEGAAEDLTSANASDASAEQQIANQGSSQTTSSQEDITKGASSYIEKAKATVQQAVEKVTEAVNGLTTDESTAKPQEKSAETTAPAPQGKSSTTAEAVTPSEGPKTPAQAETPTNKVRPGSSWANIARGPSSSPVESK